MNTTKKSGPRLRAAVDRNDPSHRFLAPGALAVVDDDRDALALMSRRVEAESGAKPITCGGLAALESRIHPPSTRVGRPPVRGFLIDWRLDRRGRTTAADVLDWLDNVYPRTPVVIYTESDPDEMRRACAARGLELVFATGMRAEDWTPGTEPLQRATPGLLRGRGGGVASVSKPALDSTALRSIETHIFGPWETRRVRVRRYLISTARPGAELSESLLRTLEAYFESVPREGLATARGIGESTVGSHLKKVVPGWGVALDSLKQRWELERYGRGGATAHRLPWQGGLTPSPFVPAPDHAVAARRVCARRGR